MRAYRLGPVLLILLLAFPGLAASQAPDAGVAAAAAAGVSPDVAVGDTVEAVLADGSRFYGRFLSGSDTTVRIELFSGGVLELERERIRTLQAFQGRVVDGEFWRPDPNATRLFFGPTARSLEQGRGYVSVYELFVPFVAVGVHERVTLAGGTPLFFFSGESERLFWFAPKLQVVRTPELSAAVGVLHFWLAGGHDLGQSHFGITYGVMTMGAEDAAFTVGAGLFYEDARFTKDVALMFGGESRSSRSVKLITENYLFPKEGMAVLSAGPRFFGEKLTADLGLAVPISTDGEGLIVLPLVNFVYNW